MAKGTWDKAVHAVPLIDNRLTQEVWHKHTDGTVAADPAASTEVRVYNPSGPHYNEPLVSAWPPKTPVATAKKETK